MSHTRLLFINRSVCGTDLLLISNQVCDTVLLSVCETLDSRRAFVSGPRRALHDVKRMDGISSRLPAVDQLLPIGVGGPVAAQPVEAIHPVAPVRAVDTAEFSEEALALLAESQDGDSQDSECPGDESG